MSWGRGVCSATLPAGFLPRQPWQAACLPLNSPWSFVQELLRSAGRLLLCWQLFQPVTAAPEPPAVPAALHLPVQYNRWCPADCGGEWAGSMHCTAQADAAARVAGRFCAATRCDSLNQRRNYGHPPCPPALLSTLQAKGNASEFVCGAPLSFAAPDIPGFTKMPGRGMFLYGQCKQQSVRLPTCKQCGCPLASVVAARLQAPGRLPPAWDPPHASPAPSLSPRAPHCR